MKRLAIKLVLFLLLGAIVNVAVAWGCTTWSPIQVSEERRHERISGAPWWSPLLSSGSFAELRAIVSRSSGFGVQQIEYTGDTPENFGKLRWGCRMTRAGYPMASLQSALEGFQGNVSVRSALVVPQWVPPAQQFDRYVPIGIIWPGFAINAIFYAAVLWLLFAAPGLIRRRLRHFRGRCLHCGYDLRGRPPDSSTCPECGRTV